MEKYRSKIFFIELYPLEDETHKKALDLIKLSYDYIAIDHDKDTLEDGTIKKTHTHVFLQFKNAKWNTSLADDLGINPCYIGKQVRSKKNCILYEIHYNEVDKYHYKVEEAYGNLTHLLKEYINNNDKTECEKVCDILTLIDNSDGYVDFNSFVRTIADCGYWDVFRRAGNIFITYLNNHNSKYRS